LIRDEGVFDKYIIRILGRLSTPKMQCSIKLRLAKEKEVPAGKINACVDEKNKIIVCPTSKRLSN
jgi:hypothetical protein